MRKRKVVPTSDLFSNLAVVAILIAAGGKGATNARGISALPFIVSFSSCPTGRKRQQRPRRQYLHLNHLRQQQSGQNELNEQLMLSKSPAYFKDDSEDFWGERIASSSSSPSSSLASSVTPSTTLTRKRTREDVRRHVAKLVFPNEPYIRIRKRIDVICSDLPLIVIDDFLSPTHCNDIIQSTIQQQLQQHGPKMTRSTTGVSQTASSKRTSSTAWLHDHECQAPLRILAGRVSRLVGLPPSHMENLQVVRYTDGQEFGMHTDHIEPFNDLDCRGRLATCLIYLNSSSSVEKEGHIDGSVLVRCDMAERGSANSRAFDGGCTYFPEYDARITPKVGRAVFWFNTIERPGTEGYGTTAAKDMKLTVDLRSRHSGEAVCNGEKWVCNRWVHPVPLDTGVRDETGM